MFTENMMPLLYSLQDDPNTNAGRGSNLTEDGHVECDASIMDGDSGTFGAVGAVPGILRADACTFCSNKSSIHYFFLGFTCYFLLSYSYP